MSRFYPLVCAKILLSIKLKKKYIVASRCRFYFLEHKTNEHFTHILHFSEMFLPPKIQLVSPYTCVIFPVNNDDDDDSNESIRSTPAIHPE